MPSSTIINKEHIRGIYKKLNVSSCSSSSLKKPSFNKIVNDVEKFDNGKYIVRTKKNWCELEK